MVGSQHIECRHIHGDTLTPVFSSTHPSRHSSGTWTLEFGTNYNCTTSGVWGQSNLWYAFMNGAGGGSRTSANGSEVFRNATETEVSKGGGYTYDTTIPTRKNRKVITNIQADTYYGTSTTPDTFVYVTTRCGERLYFVRTYDSPVYRSGVMGAMLSCKLTREIMTSGEKTCKYSTNPGWEIIN